jgi:stalled ribosome rescue protein Dom34
MSVKNQKQFGVWMDSHHATVVGQADPGSSEFSVLGHVKNPGADGNSSESAEQHQKQTLLHHFFKEIASHLTNAEEVHITGPGTTQEQFIHYLAETPQFRNTATSECTTTPMSDEGLIEHIAKKFA